MQRLTGPDWVCAPSDLQGVPMRSRPEPLSVDLFVSTPCGAGRVAPNTEAWAGGDVILFRRRRSAVAHTAIATYQRACGVTVAGCEVAHVAVYDGRGCLWDAMPRENVRQRAIWRAIGGSEIARFRLNVNRLDEDRLHRALVDLKGCFYNLRVLRLRDLGRRRLARATSKQAQEDDFPVRSVICSTFVERVLFFACRRLLFEGAEVALPGDFVDSGVFHAEPLEWRRC